MRLRRAALTILLLIPVFSFAEPKADSGFVLQAFETLRENYYDPKSLDAAALFNAALKVTADALKENKIDFVPSAIPAKTSLENAKKIFQKEFSRALSLRPPGLTDKTLVFIATAIMLRAVGTSHIYFIGPEATAERDKSNSGEPLFSGIGVVLGKFKDGRIYFNWVYKDGPADKAGLRRFDALSEIDGVPVGKKPDLGKIVSQIRGPKGSAVKITVKRPKGKFSASVVREEIKDPKPEMRTLKERGKEILYVRLYQFSDHDHLFSFDFYRYRNHKEEGIIIDLRDNPGGSLSAVDDYLGMFLSKNTPTYSLKSRNKLRHYFSKSFLLMFSVETNLPIVVLINENSASGSEILAAVLREQRGAKIVGIKSAGAVSAARTFDLPFGSSMMVAVEAFTTAKGKVLEGVGVIPDIKVELTEKDIFKGEDAQLLKALSLF